MNSNRIPAQPVKPDEKPLTDALKVLSGPE